MTDLADFLLARIAEDEDVAKAATAGPWRLGVDRDSNGMPTVESEISAVLTAGGEYCADLWLEADPNDLAHVIRWDPARVLAECESKRRIVTEGGGSSMLDVEGAADWEHEWTLQMLALPYAGHPDYREEWRV